MIDNSINNRQIQELETNLRDQIAELSRSAATFQLIFRNTFDGIIILDLQGTITEINPRVSEVLGLPREQILGMSAFNFAIPGQQSRLIKEWNQLRKTGFIKGSEYKLNQAAVPGKIIEINASVLKDAAGNRCGYVVMARDITAHKITEEALLKSQKRFQALVETTCDFIWEMNADGVYTYCSPQIEKLWGYKPGDMVGKTPFENMTVEEKKRAIDLFHANLTGPGPVKRMEFTSFDSSGKLVILEISAVPFFDNQTRLLGFRGITRDITEKKQIESEKQQFTRRLIEVQEEERKRVSRELHDETAQYLALLTLEIGNMVLKGEKLSPEIAANLKKLKNTAEKALQEVRRYSHELRPSVLEHFGLAEGLRLIIGEFNEITSIKVSFKVYGEEIRLKEEIEVAFFRIAQEALSNMRKHSRAHKAEVSLRYLPEKLRLTLTDDGIGFDAVKMKVAGTRTSLGLVGMRERANLIGATLKIKSKVGQGTTISVEGAFTN